MAHYLHSIALQEKIHTVMLALQFESTKFHTNFCSLNPTEFHTNFCSLNPTKSHTNFHSAALQKKIDADMLALQQQVEDAQRLQVTSKVRPTLKFFEMHTNFHSTTLQRVSHDAQNELQVKGRVKISVKQEEERATNFRPTCLQSQLQGAQSTISALVGDKVRLEAEVVELVSSCVDA